MVDTGICVNCGRCAETCPVLRPLGRRNPIAVFAARNRNEESRLKSSSGGVFSALSHKVLQKGGVVFGACFERGTWRVIHRSVESESDLKLILGSKYVQSDIGDSYVEAKRYLDCGRIVLFSGCPCQVSALKRFLGRDYSNLILVDFFCHSVPSPLAWQEYLKCRMRDLGIPNFGSLGGISFRDKKFGWKGFSVRIEGEKGMSYLKRSDQDLFLRGFHDGVFSRPSCYRCRFKNGRGTSDLTLADYWAFEGKGLIVDDDMGVSAVFVNTECGSRLLQTISKDLVLERRTSSDVLRENRAWKRSLECDRYVRRKRLFFFGKIKSSDFDTVMAEIARMRAQSMFSPYRIAWWLKRLIVNGEVNKL